MHGRVLSFMIAACVALCFARLSWAQPYPRDPDPLGSNPPVFQSIGMIDGAMDMLSEADCRLCHAGGLPDRHHLLYGEAISNPAIVPYPDTDGDGVPDTNFSCLSCHGQNFVVERNCVACHDTGSPHHTGPDAVGRHCSVCHGNLVADYDDGHYIPTYSPSLVTPWTGLHGAGWNDLAHLDPHRESDGSGVVQDTDVLVLDTGVTLNFGDVLTRTDPAELRFRPPDPDNDFMISEPNFETNVYHVVFQQGGTLGASWVQSTNTLTVTVAPTQTAAELIAAINAAVTATTGPRVQASKLLSDGTGDLLPDHEYAPLGGLPLNNRGFGAGSCSYCHDDDGALDINGDSAPALIRNNHDNHHDIGLPYMVSNGSGGMWAKCNLCHAYTNRPGGDTHDHASGPAFDLHIRICEECHSLKSLHNIQADSPKTPGTIIVGGELAGYGHVGRDGAAGDNDCWGCHGFQAAANPAPFTGPLVPTLYDANARSVLAGKRTTLQLSGAAFTNEANGLAYSSDVRLIASDGSSVTLTPDLIRDEGQMTVTIPANLRPGNYKLQAAKGDVASNPVTVSVVPRTVITKAVVDRDVTITGSGFGGYAKGSGTMVTGTVTSARGGRPVTTEGRVLSWSDTEIVVAFRTLPQTMTVHSVFGRSTIRIGGR